MYRFIINIIIILICCFAPSSEVCKAQYVKSSINEYLNIQDSKKIDNIEYDISKYMGKSDVSDIIIDSWQKYNWFIISLFILLVAIIILGYQLISIRSQNKEIVNKLNARYNHIKNLESDTALLTNILKAVNANSWVINLDTNEIYYILGNSSDIKVITSNSLKSTFVNFIHPDYQNEFIEKLRSCKNKQSKDFDITYLVHRKHSKHEYEWYWSRGIVTTRRNTSGKPYLALSGITMNIEVLKRSQIDLEGTKSEIKELKDSCRNIRFEIAREINETIRTRKKLTKDLANDDLTSKERKTTYKELKACDKIINNFITSVHKSLK